MQWRDVAWQQAVDSGCRARKSLHSARPRQQQGSMLQTSKGSRSNRRTNVQAARENWGQASAGGDVRMCSQGLQGVCYTMLSVQSQEHQGSSTGCRCVGVGEAARAQQADLGQCKHDLEGGGR